MDPNTRQAATFVQTLGKYLSDFNFLLVRDGDQISLLNQATGEVQNFSDCTFPIVFKGQDSMNVSYIPNLYLGTTYLKPSAFTKPLEGIISPPILNNGHPEEGEMLSESLELPSTPGLEHDDTEDYHSPDHVHLPESLQKTTPLQKVTDDLKPEHQGHYFALAVPLAENQQRERIAICPPSSYPVLVMKRDSPQPPNLVVTDVRSHNCSPLGSFRQQSSVDAWPGECKELELHPKTPELLSNNLDKDADQSIGATSFFFHFKIFFWNEKSGSYQLLDELTSSAFRTVSHSKLCDSKRRMVRKKKRSRARRTSKHDDSSEDFDRYEPY